MKPTSLILCYEVIASEDKGWNKCVCDICAGYSWKNTSPCSVIMLQHHLLKHVRRKWNTNTCNFFTKLDTSVDSGSITSWSLRTWSELCKPKSAVVTCVGLNVSHVNFHCEGGIVTTVIFKKLSTQCFLVKYWYFDQGKIAWVLSKKIYWQQISNLINKQCFR